jgi:hypothetical protein
MIPDAVLRRAQGLSTLAYTGVLLFLPPARVRRYWQLVERTTEEIIGAALAAWGELAEEITETIEEASS